MPFFNLPSGGGGAGLPVLTGEGAPSNSVGSNGQLYIDTAGGVFYVKAEGDWGTGIEAGAGDWSELTGKPSTFPPSTHSHGWTEITDKPSTFAPSTHSHGWTEITDKPTTFAPSTHSHSISDVSSLQTTLTGLQSAIDGKQEAGSYATLDGGGKVPSSQLPSFVDDVAEYSSLAAFPATGEAAKLYVATDANKTYRWSGTAYVEIVSSPGTTDAVTEGSTNLYFTTARAAAAAPVQSVAGRTGTVTLAVADVANAVATSDARLSDSREWTAATVSQSDAEAGTSTTRVAFTPLRAFQAIAAWWAASAAKTKLDGIAAGATANQTDAHLLARANHTGTQTAATISDFSTAAASAAPVQSVAGRTGAVTLAVGDVSNAVANAGSVSAIRRLTQAQYDAISSPDATTLYVIIG